MEVLAWMYMLDNRWLWGIGYPQRPSTIFGIIGLISWAVAVFTCIWESVYTQGTVTERLKSFDGHWEFRYVVSLLLNGGLCFTLWRHQHRIESKKLYDPKHNIDEIALRVNHYFKIQESIKSFLGWMVLFVGIAKTFFAFWFCFSQKTRKYEISGHPDQVLAFIELCCFFNLVLVAMVYLVVKLTWQVL